MSNHTPVPWTVDECPDAAGNFTIRPWDGSPHGDIDAPPIATVYKEANTRLMAAAPELLEALVETVDLLDAYTQGDHSGRPWLYRAQATIAKAKGESQC